MGDGPQCVTYRRSHRSSHGADRTWRFIGRHMTTQILRVKLQKENTSSLREGIINLLIKI